MHSVSPILINVILSFHLYRQMKLSHFAYYKKWTKSLPLNIPIPFRSNTLYMTKKKKEKKKEHQALASAFFDDLSKSLGPFSLYLLLAPFSLLFYRILICIASHRLAAGFIRTRGKYGGINVGHLVWKKKEKGGWKAGRR